MSTPIPEYLWLWDYEQRLEYLTTTQRDRATAAMLPMLSCTR